MNKAIEQKINNIYWLVFKKVFTNINIQALAKNDPTRLRMTILALDNSKQYATFAQEFAKELSKQGLNTKRGIWRKYYKAAKAMHYIALPPTYKDYEMSVYADAVRHNFEMIKSIPTKMLDILNHKYVSTLIEEVAKGTLSRGAFKRELESHGHKNAKVIARTETSKLQSIIIENRARKIGSIAYIWQSSNDIRTRPSHREMNGVVVFWSDSNLDKPYLDGMYGNAGEFPNCRCAASPIVDLDQLTKTSYKVYDNTEHKIITMRTSALIQALKKGGMK